MTKAEQERLIKLAEECAETIQIISKILQYGYEEHYPKDPHNNKERLEHELGDIRFWLREMYLNGDIDIFKVMRRTNSKYDKAMQYTQYQEDSTWEPA